MSAPGRGPSLRPPCPAAPVASSARPPLPPRPGLSAEPRRGGPHFAQLLGSAARPTPARGAPGSRAGVPTHSAAAAARSWAGREPLLRVSSRPSPGPLRTGSARSSPPPSARPPARRSLPPSSSSRRPPNPAEPRPSPTWERKAASHPGAGRLGVGLRPGRGRGEEGGRGPEPRRGGRAQPPLPAAPPQPRDRSPRGAVPEVGRQCGLLQPVCLP